jgi:transglutaminase-like putative cysteine protease
MNKEAQKRDWGTFFLYIFGFVLLWEWIRPLKELTDTGNIGVFIFYLLLSFLLSFLQTKMWLSFSVKLLYILSTIYSFYYEGGFFSFDWIAALFKDMKSNVFYVMAGNWVDLSNPFRTILFFLLLWLMTYLIHYWLLNRKRIFLFFVVTLIYITMLDTFTQYSAKEAIVRAIITGFAAMGILTLNRIIIQEKIGKDFTFSKKWMTALTILIALSVGIGIITPKAEPIWPDPVPFIKSLNEKSGGPGTQKIGYGVDDSELGGDFVGDNSVVFRAEAETKHYWKVETKDVYTGKGWVASDSNDERISLNPDEPIPIYSFDGDVEARERKAIIYPSITYPHIVYPFGVHHVKLDGNGALGLNEIIEKLYYENQQINDRPYGLEYSVPRYSVTKLQQVISSEQSRLAPEFMAKYTQLPANLPPEIHELALEVTKDQKTWFDKARAVERYFDKAIFTYNQKNVAVPGRNDDYVAQFLFETHVGYCDNFSSSMIVMLRTLGIPARWVKGYTAGEFKQIGDSGDNIYEVTNNNAHSWVEVYFPGSGWLTFEPTPGFTNNVNLNFDTYKNDNTPDTPIPAPVPEKEKPKTPADNGVKENKADFSFKALWLDFKFFFNREWKWFVFGPLVLALFLFFLYRKRTRWMPHYLVWKYSFKKEDDSFNAAYLVLLKQLDLYGLKRKDNQTLRDYAKYVDSYFVSKEMSRLTDRYEKLLYKGSLRDGVWLESKELWENLIKKTIA